MKLARQKLEVDRNYDAFARLLCTLLAEHRDQLALMRDGEVVGFYNSPRDALQAASEKFSDGIFSIQK